MKLIIGLGNPGLAYSNTRHNLGARVVKAVARKYRVKLKLNRSLKSRIAILKEENYILAIPNTFMNLSGEAVNLLVRRQDFPLEDVLIIHDDLDLELGEMRFRKSGSSAGHKGIESIITSLDSQEFNRLKLGIGKALYKDATKDHVLSVFSKKESKIVDKIIDVVMKACEIWVKFGIEKAMNEFN